MADPSLFQVGVPNRILNALSGLPADTPYTPPKTLQQIADSPPIEELREKRAQAIKAHADRLILAFTRLRVRAKAEGNELCAQELDATIARYHHALNRSRERIYSKDFADEFATCWREVVNSNHTRELASQDAVSNSAQTQAEWIMGLTDDQLDDFISPILTLPFHPAPTNRRLADAPPDRPVQLLKSWGEILTAIGQKKGDLKSVQRLNGHFDGPIPKPTQGRQPVVDRDKLLDWWNNLAAVEQDRSNQRAGRRLSGESEHAYGKSGTVAPEISGRVKKRRQRAPT